MDHSIPVTKADRIRGMIWGQFVGDAAALGTHWVYDLNQLSAAFPAGIRGFESPGLAAYHAGKQPGDQTHYGDAALLLLESIAAKGRLDLRDFAQRFVSFFGAPNCASYKDHATRETLAHLAAAPDDLANGADDDQPATVTRLAPVVAIHGRDPAAVIEVTRFCQNHPRAAAYAGVQAQLLSALLEGAELRTALEAVSEPEPATSIAAALAAQDRSTTEVTLGFGQGCPLPQTFPSAVHAALKHGPDFRGAVLATIAAGGDNAARAALVGSWLGAERGLAAIPPEWCEQLNAAQRIHESIEEILTNHA